MTVRELIDRLLDFPMDAKVNAFVGIENRYLKEMVDVEGGEDICDWFNVSRVDSTNYLDGRVVAHMIIE